MTAPVDLVTATVSRAPLSTTGGMPMCERRSGQPDSTPGPCGTFADFVVNGETLVCDSHLPGALNAVLPELPDDEPVTDSAVQ